jgi:RsiW-degrading membrane proteinase PrsW (M82 family)
MIIALVFAYVWGVVQLIVLGSLARTVRVRTVVAALAVGIYACAPLAVFLQVAWSRPAAWLSGASLYTVGSVASYTLDPLIEEVLKVLPVVGLLLLATIRRQWSLTDCVLIGAAVGSGFGLAESLYRYGSAAHLAHATGDGWILGTSAGLPYVPSVWTSMRAWLPQGAGPSDGVLTLNPHLVWSTLGGLAVGLVMLRRGWTARLVATVLFAYIVVDHAAMNAIIKGQRWGDAGAIHVLRDQLWLAPIVALGVAWWLDRSRQRTVPGDSVLLAAEEAASPRLLGTVRAAVARLPWSPGRVYGLVRMRRAYNSARTIEPTESAGSLRAALVRSRDRVEREGAGPDTSSRGTAVAASHAWTAALRRRSSVVPLVLLIPSLVYFLVGGWPQTASVQRAFGGPWAWRAIIALTVASQAWILWRLIGWSRSWPTVRRLPIADDTAVACLRAACGVGAVGLGGFAISRAFTGLPPHDSLLHDLHAVEAFDLATAVNDVQLANSAVINFSPDDAVVVTARPRDVHSAIGNKVGGLVPPPDWLRTGMDDASTAPAAGPDPDMSLDEAMQWAREADLRDADAAAEAAAADARVASDRYNSEEIWYGGDERAYDAAYEAMVDANAKADAAAAYAESLRHPEAAAAAVAAAAQAHAEAQRAHGDAVSDYEAAHAAYEKDIAVARAADAAERAANPGASPHAATDIQAAAQATADELHARIAAAARHQLEIEQAIGRTPAWPKWPP